MTLDVHGRHSLQLYFLEVTCLEKMLVILEFSHAEQLWHGKKLVIPFRLPLLEVKCERSTNYHNPSHL